MRGMSLKAMAVAGLSICVVACGRTAVVVDPETGFEVLSGPYLGQAAPGKEPQIFAPGLVTTHGLDIDIAFLNEARVCVFSNSTDRVFFTFERNGRWVRPREATFPDEEGKTQYSAGPDGRTLYFQSSRLTSASDGERDLNTWSVEWTGTGWTDPRPLPFPANTYEYHEICPSMASNGDLYFFSGWRKDAPLGDLYRVAASSGPDTRIEKLPFPVNTAYHELDPVVSPDGSALIFFSNRPGGSGFGGLYVTFSNDDGTWTRPRSLGRRINSFHPNAASITSDGRYFFFTSSRPTTVPKGAPVQSTLIDKVGDIDLYWVETGFIADIERDFRSKKSAAEIIDRDYRTNGLQASLATMKRLSREDADDHDFPLSELLATCAHMIDLGRMSDAETFFQAMLENLPGPHRIRQGFAAVCIFHGHAELGIEILRSVWSEVPALRSQEALEPVVSTLGFTGRTDDELLLLEFIAQEFPDSYLARFNLARALQRKGDVDPAREHCRIALEQKPDFAEAAQLLRDLEGQK